MGHGGRAGGAELCRCFWCARWVRECPVRVWACRVRVCAGGAGWYGPPMRTLHIGQGIYYNRKKKEKHEKRAEPAKTGMTVKTVKPAKPAML